MFKKITQLFGADPHQRKVNALMEVVTQINALEPEYEALSDAALGAKTQEFKQRLAGGETLDDLLPEAFAAVREASKRTLGQRHYDVQMITGITLHRGEIAEMKTGEGKTLSATLPLYLNALAGRGAHLVTVNDYLARRDGRWMGTIYRFLGLSVGILQMSARTESGLQAFIYNPDKRSPIEEQDQLDAVPRKLAYQADITYGTNNEFGFDYLRDNLTDSKETRAQRGHYYAIIDEVDNILIDEARTPLIISGPSHDDTEWYVRMAQVVKQLVSEDFEISEKDRTVTLSEIGLAHVEELLDMPLSDPERPEDITSEQESMLGFLEQALRAEFLFHRNKEYIVQNKEVVIVDEFTGRLMPGRRWSDGLHQAVEAKEGVRVQAENVTYATITLQNYFRMYEKLAGMTGTALTEAEEFDKIYKLEVLPIPTHLEYQAMGDQPSLAEIVDKDEQGYKFSYYYRPGDETQAPLFWKRMDFPDVVYQTGEAKLRAIVKDIIYYHVVGRPQLVGTTSVESSERLSERLGAGNVRRLLEVLLIRQAYLQHKNLQEHQMVSIPELDHLYVDLDQLHSPELRRTAREYGLTSLSPLDEGNRDHLLQILNLSTDDWPRLDAAIKSGVPHQVLNARKHTEESKIIAGAGAFGAVTIATNMAGRGVDIKLGGELPEEGLSRVNRFLVESGVPDAYNLPMQDRLEALDAIPPDNYGDDAEDVEAFLTYMAEMKRVRELGGLHVIGSERHEARRIDNQLRGRAARQGDPGSSRFYLSMEDELMRLFGGGQAESLLARLNIDKSLPIEHGIVGRLVESAQVRVEGANFDVREHLLEYDDVLNAQRKRIYEQRDRIFDKEDLREDVTEMLRTEVSRRVQKSVQDEEGLWKLLAYLDGIQPTIDQAGVFHPSFALQVMMDEIGKPATVEALQKRLIDIAEESLEVWYEHVLHVAEASIRKEELGFENLLAEKLDSFDTFVDGLKYDEQRQVRDIKGELYELIHVPLRLTDATAEGLYAGSRKTVDEVTAQIRNTLMQISIRRLIRNFERQLVDNWNLKAAELSDQSWDQIHALLLERVADTLDRRRAYVLGSTGEIQSDLQANQDLLTAALENPAALMRTLNLLTQGRMITFDERTHQPVTKRVIRLQYHFKAAQCLADLPPDTLQQRIIRHLETAQDKLAELLGVVETMRLYNSGLTLGDLSADWQDRFPAELGSESYQAIQTLPVDQLPRDVQKPVHDILGRFTQNQLYRQILLSRISESWVDYLTRMEALRVSVRMEAYGQRDPLVTYKNQATEMFSGLLSDIRVGVTERMFRIRLVSKETVKAAQTAPQPAEKQLAPSGSKKRKKKSRKRH